MLFSILLRTVFAQEFEQSDKTMGHYLQDYSHVFNNPTLTNGSFLPKDIGQYQFDLDKDAPNRDYLKYLEKKYQNYKDSNNTTICFQNKDEIIETQIGKQYLPQILHGVGLTMADIASRKDDSFQFGNRTYPFSVPNLGEELYNRLEMYRRTGFTITVTQRPNDVASILELQTENQEKIRIPIRLSGRNVEFNQDVYWIINGITTSILVDFDNATHRELFNQIIDNEHQDIGGQIATTITYPRFQQPLGNHSYEMIVLDSAGLWLNNHSINVPTHMIITTGNSCDLNIEYGFSKIRINTELISTDLQDLVDKIFIIDAKLYNHQLSLATKNYVYPMDDTYPEMSYEQFENLTIRPHNCNQTCAQSFSLLSSTSSLKASNYLSKCQLQCENSISTKQCLDDVLKIKVPLEEMHLLSGFQVEAIEYCHKQASPSLKEQQEFINGQTLETHTAIKGITKPVKNAIPDNATTLLPTISTDSSTATDTSLSAMLANASKSVTTNMTVALESRSSSSTSNIHIPSSFGPLIHSENLRYSRIFAPQSSLQDLCLVVFNIGANGQVKETLLENCELIDTLENQMENLHNMTFESNSDVALPGNFHTIIPLKELIK